MRVFSCLFLGGLLFLFGSCQKTKERPPGVSTVAKEKVLASLLSEIWQVVFLKMPTDVKLFQEYLNALVQGASLEGIYNGFVYSVVYRRLEQQDQIASKNAREFFLRELHTLEGEFEIKPIYTTQEGMPLTDFKFETFAAEAALRSPSQIKDDNSLKKGGGEQVFKNSKFFTLKRVLCGYYLRLIDEKQYKQEKLIAWYSAWVTHMAQYDVDFGLPERNQKDAGYHQKWAVQVPLDRLKWEVLNRVHRTLNKFQSQKP